MERNHHYSSLNVSRLACACGLICLMFGQSGAAAPRDRRSENPDAIALPPPKYSSACSVESALQQRRVVTDYLPGALTLPEVAQLAWAAQGVTDAATGRRTAPSFEELYPVHLYLVVGNVQQLAAGVYRYESAGHALTRLAAVDMRADVAKDALRQRWAANAPVLFVFTAEYDRAARKFGERGAHYIDMEIGQIAQNVYLQAFALQLGAAFIESFGNDDLMRLLNLPPQESPLGVMAIGRMP